MSTPQTEDPETQLEAAKRQADALWKQTLSDCLHIVSLPFRVQIAVVVSFYFVTSISLVFLNKILLSGYDFPYPLFITWYQLIVALGLLFVLGALGQSYPMLNYFRPFEFNYDIARKVLPLMFVFIGMISFNNLCLKYVEVSFYQVARSLTICMSIALTYFVLNTTTSSQAIQASVVIFVGFVIGSYGEVNFTMLGVVYGVLSSFFVALYGIYVRKIIEVVDKDEQRLIIYNTVLSVFGLLPLVFLSGEVGQLMNNPLIYNTRFWFMMTLAGVAGLLINTATYLQIKFTSPLTHAISGTAKACVQTILGVMIYQNPVSFLNGVGILLVILGSFLYSYVRYLEMKK